MGDLTISAVRLVRGSDEHQHTAPAAVAITVGQAIRIDTNGKWELADGSGAGTLGDVYIADRTAAIGETVTGFKAPCLLDVGAALDALAFGALVYVSNTAGALGDAAGDVSKVAGTVVPGWAQTTAQKLLRVEL
jgi:hypothetical protein